MKMILSSKKLDFIVSDELQYGNAERLERLYNELINKDWSMTLIDSKNTLLLKNKCLLITKIKNLDN